MLSVFVFLPIAYFFEEYVNDWIWLGLMSIGITFSVLQFVISFFVKCPKCSKRITVLFFKKPHPNSNVESGIELVFKWFSGNVCCVHCGCSVDTNGI